MAITLRAAGTAATGTTSVVVSQPTGTTTGDVLLAFIVDHATTGTTTPPTGWTLAGTPVAGTAGRFQVFWAVVGSGGLTGTSWTWSGLTTKAEGVICGYIGATATPLDVTPSYRLNASGTVGTTSITPVTNGDMIVAGYAALASGSTFSSYSTTSPGALTNQFFGANASFCSIEVAGATQTTAGATGVSTATMGTAGANAAVLIALKPATILTATGGGNVTASGAATTTATGTSTYTGGGSVSIAGAATTSMTSVAGAAYYKSLTVDHTQVGASDSTNFPLTICLDGSVQAVDADLKTVGNGGYVQSSSGYDIRPYSDSALSTPLTYELVSYTATTGALEMHVLLPTLSHTADTVIYLAFGDSSITTDGSSSSVWSAYRCVYHLANGTTLNLNDSTANAHNATGVNSPTAGAAAVDGGVVLNGSNQRLDTGHYDFGSTTGSGFQSGTISCWVQATGYGGFALYQDGVGHDSFTLTFPSSSTGTLSANLNDGTYSAFVSTKANFALNTPYLIGVSWDVPSTTVTVWVNGVADATYSSPAFPNGTLGYGATIGAYAFGGAPTSAGFFPGWIDEVRSCTTALSASWQLAEYNSQKTSSTLITWGTKVANGGTVATGSGTVTVAGAATTVATGTVSYTGSGSITAAGAATTVATGTVSYTASGSVVAAGAATVVAVENYLATGSGSVTVSGAATVVATANALYTGTGSVTVAGAATTAATGTVSFTGTGSVVVSGAATTAPSANYVATGGGSVAISGTATTSMTVTGAITYIQSNSTGYAPGATSSCAFTSNNTAGNFLIALGNIAHLGTPTVSDTAGNTWVQLTNNVAGTGNTNISAYYCQSCVGGANTVTLGGSTSGNSALTIAEFSGVNTLDANGTGANSSAATTWTSNSITTARPDELLIGCIVSGGGSLTINTPFTTLGINETFLLGFYEIVSATQTGVSASGGCQGTTSWSLSSFYNVVNKTATGSGSVTVSGSATTSFTKQFAAIGSGSVTATGSATTSDSTNYLVVGSGNISVSGSASVVATENYLATGSGSVVISGTATTLYSRIYAATGSGSVVVAGAATTSSSGTTAFTGSGSITASGAATVVVTEAYLATGSGSVTVSGTAVTSFSGTTAFTGSGSVAISGTATTTDTVQFSATGTGSVVAAGTATTAYSRQFVVAGSGTVTATGAATVVATSNYLATGSGTVTLTGSAVTSTSGSGTYVGTGTVTVTGSAATTFTGQFAATGSGAVVISGAGTSTYTRQFAQSGSGAVVLSGAATSLISVKYVVSGSGSVTVAGTAVTQALSVGFDQNQLGLTITQTMVGTVSTNPPSDLRMSSTGILSTSGVASSTELTTITVKVTGGLD